MLKVGGIRPAKEILQDFHPRLWRQLKALEEQLRRIEGRPHILGPSGKLSWQPGSSQHYESKQRSGYKASISTLDRMKAWSATYIAKTQQLEETQVQAEQFEADRQIDNHGLGFEHGPVGRWRLGKALRLRATYVAREVKLKEASKAKHTTIKAETFESARAELQRVEEELR
ncbi:hypothetical protein ACLOJK_000853 [Asimina triloba]